MSDYFAILISLFFYPAFSTVVAYVWINTDAFIEYVKVFRLGPFFNIEEYEEKNAKMGASLTYPDFLCFQNSNFFTRLASCPVCVTVWIQIAMFVFHFNLGLLFSSIYISWILYFILTKLSL